MTKKLFMRFSVLLGVVVFAAVIFWSTNAALAESGWPTGPVNIIVHTKPGGAADIFARTLAKSLKPVIGQSIVVINAPGGGGATQMAKVRPAKPDGLTLGICTLTQVGGMLANLKGTFALDDFSWVVAAQEAAMLMFVRSGSDISKFDDLVARARTSKKTVNIGGYGPVGSQQNIGLMLLAKAAQVKFDWVAFNSSPDVIAAVLGGHVDAGVSNFGSMRPYFKAGRISGVGVLRKERLDGLPDMPTFSEQGYDADSSWVQVRGLYGPAGIPLETQKKIANAVREAMASENYTTYAEGAGITNSWMGPEEFTRFLNHASGIAEAQLRAVGVIK